ncbi:hypothetical protein KEM54_005767 [Ascosphaera aggregata]|nr:hypothetical protein KEM54_005767 [Ascosphaera aggregata]
MTHSPLPSTLNSLLSDPVTLNSYDALHLTEQEARAVLSIDLAREIFLEDEDGDCGCDCDDDDDDQVFAHQDNGSQIIKELTVDGVAVYSLIPHVELLAAAVGISQCHALFQEKEIPAILLRLRTNLLHQKMLSEVTTTLQDVIFNDLSHLKSRVLLVEGEESSSQSSLKDSKSRKEEKARLYLESATLHIHHGFDAQARSDLENAARQTGFQYAITGRLGRRTKFQTRDISQLVVLAKSADSNRTLNSSSSSPSKEKDNENIVIVTAPKQVNLDDDTLLERISFTKEGEKVLTGSEDKDENAEEEENHIESTEKSMTVSTSSSLPPSLASLDPSSQPILAPLDSIILLSLASAITNTSPQHGLTREETLPYAVRVIEGGSSNWQVYSQALLVRSKIEGYRSRTVERGLLQLQALVDQVVADTTPNHVTAEKGKQNILTTCTVTNSGEEEEEVGEAAATTFLPRAHTNDSAPAEERLKYIWFLDFKTRWDLEAELASRWVSVGGLRTALEIYERLQMWAEVALCYAATEREDKARMTIRRQLFQQRTRTNEHRTEEITSFKAGGEEEELPLSELPPDAARLFCILGDIDSEIKYYERAWDVSNHRFARAQRSIARWHLSQSPPNYLAAESAYLQSLQINRLNHQAWFALGCVQLELAKFPAAVESFTRTVQLEEEDAEAWSNLAAALMNLPEPTATTTSSEEAALSRLADDEDETNLEAEMKKNRPDPYKHKREALGALRRAAKFKRDESRIWENLLTVAASIPPSAGTPFEEVIYAMERIIALRSAKQGEKCIDVDILTTLITVLTHTEYDPLHANKPGTLSRRIIKLIDESVIPCITLSSALWLLVSRVEAWRHRPAKALDAQEKSWRAVLTMYTPAAFGSGDEKAWNKIVEATIRVVREGYAGLGMKVREEDDAEGEGRSEESELVAKDWRFKSRSAIRSVLGKGKEYFQETEGWDKLKELQSEIAGGNH